MTSLLPPSASTTEFTSCAACGAIAIIDIVRVIDTEEALVHFLEFGVNASICRCCGRNVQADVPLRIHVPDGPIPPIHYLPYESLEDPEVLESLAQQNPRILMAYSMDELLRVIHANLCIAAFRDRLEGRYFQPECLQP
jgi:hypothetical protein